jgi:hypothetical protein
MKKFYVLLCLSFLFNLSAWAKESIRGQVQALLPKELASLSSADSRQSLEDRFSKKIKKKEDPNNLYLNYFEDKNDVTLGTNKGQFEYIYVEFPQAISKANAGFYQKILRQLTPDQKKVIEENIKKNTSHEAGRYILLDLPEEGLKLEFFNNEKYDLRSAIIFSQEKK